MPIHEENARVVNAEEAADAMKEKLVGNKLVAVYYEKVPHKHGEEFQVVLKFDNNLCFVAKASGLLVSYGAGIGRMRPNDPDFIPQ